MVRRPPLALVILLLSFPQIVETLYSPALPMIAQAYRVSAGQAAQTLSLWFVAFAFGVVVWGRLCDLLGRRPTLLVGLALYALGAGWALVAGDFAQLLGARLLSAFGAAVGSIVTQTALRDSYHGAALARVFSWLGIALAVSPAVGMWLGQELVAVSGPRGVFAGLGLLAACLLGLGLAFWPETRAAEVPAASLRQTLRRMLGDHQVWRSAALVAIFNLAIFGFYQLGPFLFERLETTWLGFGESGLALAAASLAGASVNAVLLRRGWSAERLLGMAVLLLTVGAAIVALCAASLSFLAGMAVIAGAYAVAIPNILAGALRCYADQLGTAGALFSMLYYNLLGAGLVVAGLGQRLDLLLLACAMGAWLLLGLARRAAR